MISKQDKLKNPYLADKEKLVRYIDNMLEVKRISIISNLKNNISTKDNLRQKESNENTTVVRKPSSLAETGAPNLE